MEEKLFKLLLIMGEKKEIGYKKQVIINLIILIGIVLYSYIINHISGSIEKEKFTYISKIISFCFLFLSIIIFEISYNKDNGTVAIYGIEVLILSISTLISFNMIQKLNITFQQYINFECITYLIYYVMKFLILYTNKKRNYLRSFSDIQEIVKSEPMKKEAYKRNKWIRKATRLSRKNVIK